MKDYQTAFYKSLLCTCMLLFVGTCMWQYQQSKNEELQTDNTRLNVAISDLSQQIEDKDLKIAELSNKLLDQPQ